MTNNGREAGDFSVPNGWQVAPLEKFGDFRSGNGFPLRYQGGQSGEIPFYKVSDMSSEGNSMLMTNANHWIDEGTRGVLGAHIMPPNAIIFAKIGAAIFLERRRLLSMNSCIDNNVMAFLPSETDANPLFFYYLLQSVPFGPLVAATALPSLSGKAIGALSFSFPPLHEQETIATALKDIDDLIASLDTLIAKKRDIKQAAMQQLLTGKTRLPGFEGEWKIVKISDFGQVQTGGTPSTANAEYWGGEVPWVTPTDITVARDISKTERQITQSGLKKISILPANTLLVTCIASIGKNAVLKIEGGCNQQINAITPNHHYNVDFLYYIFEYNSNYLKARASITATPIISKRNFERFEFMVPKRDEQDQIASILREIDEEITSLTAQLRKIADLKTAVSQQLLTGRIRLV